MDKQTRIQKLRGPHYGTLICPCDNQSKNKSGNRELWQCHPPNRHGERIPPTMACDMIAQMHMQCLQHPSYVKAQNKYQ